MQLFLLSFLIRHYQLKCWDFWKVFLTISSISTCSWDFRVKNANDRWRELFFCFDYLLHQIDVICKFNTKNLLCASGGFFGGSSLYFINYRAHRLRLSFSSCGFLSFWLLDGCYLVFCDSHTFFHFLMRFLPDYRIDLINRLVKLLVLIGKKCTLRNHYIVHSRQLLD